MQESRRSVDTKFALTAVGVTVFIVYGSLFPFHFRNVPSLAGPMRSLAATWHNAPGRGDLLANLVLYVPFGLFSAASLRRGSAYVRILAVTIMGLALAASIELAQFYIPGRVSAFSDVYSNTAGALLGAAAGTLLFRPSHSFSIGKLGERPFVVLLLGCWLGFRLFPYVPTIDLHKYWTALMPLFHSPSFSPLELYRQTAAWLAVAVLLEALAGTARSGAAIFLFGAAVLVSRITLLGAVLSPAEVGGVLLASVAWSTVLIRLPARVRIVAALFVGGVVLQALEPFTFTAEPRPFEWIPFIGFFQGSTAINIQSIVDKSFSYGAFIWLMVRAGLSLTVAAGLGSGLVLVLRVIQIFLPGRSAGITDTIMVLLLAGAIKLMGEDPRRTSAGIASETPWWRSRLLMFYDRLTREDPVQPVDLIFVLAGRVERKHYGFELYRAGLAPRLILSTGRFEVSKMAGFDAAIRDALRKLRDRTPPGERHFFVEMNGAGTRISQARLSRWSTFGEALALRRFIEGAGVRTVMIISTGLHLRRVASTYARVFDKLPVTLFYCPVPERFGFPARSGWWTRPQDRLYVIQETLKLAGYQFILSGPAWVRPWLMRVRG